jgi:glycogen(starch) synthase
MSTQRVYEGSPRVGPPVRIAYVVLDPYRTASRALRQVATLQGAGYEARVFSLAQRHRGGGFTAERGIPVVRLQPGRQRGRHIRGRWGGGSRPVAVWRFWGQSSAAVVEWQPDVIHCQGGGALPGAAQAAAELDVPLIYDSAELWRGRRGAGRAAVERRFIRRAARVVAASDAAADWLQQRYALTEPVMVVRNSVAPRAAFRSAPGLRELAGAEVGRLIVHTGPVTRGQGLTVAVDALRDLPDDVLLVVLGPTDPLKVRWLRRRISGDGVAGRVRFVAADRTDRIIELAAQADLAVIGLEPSCLAHRLALPSELFMAVQAGLPVVASDLPDIAAMVRRYGCGLTFRPGDAAALVRAATSMFAEEEAARAGAAIAARELSWERERYRLLELYTGLAGLSHLQDERHRPVVHQLDGHVGAEPPSLHVSAASPKGGHDLVHQRLGDRSGGSRSPARPAPLAGVGVQRELADDQQRRPDIGG